MAPLTTGEHASRPYMSTPARHGLLVSVAPSIIAFPDEQGVHFATAYRSGLRASEVIPIFLLSFSQVLD